MYGSKTAIKTSGPGILVSLIVVLLGVCSGAVAAPREGGLAIVGIWVGEHSDARIAADVMRRLRQLGEEVQSGRAHSKADWSCADAPCLSRAAEELGADRLLLASIQEVDRDNQSYLIGIRFFDKASQRIEERQVNCDGCAGSEARAQQIAVTTAKFVETNSKTIDQEQAANSSDGIARASKSRIPVGSGSDQALPILQEPAYEGSALSNSRKPVALLLAGIGIASGLVGVGMSILAANPPCWIQTDSLPDVIGVPTAGSRNTCKNAWLSASIASWGVAVLSSSAAVTVRYLKRRK